MSKEKIYQNPREEIMKKVAEDMELSLEEIEKVVSWSYMKANKAMRDVKHIEISGLGKLMVSKAKAKRRIKSLEERLLTDISEEKKIESNAELDFVKAKLDEQIEGVSCTPTEGIEESR